MDVSKLSQKLIKAKQVILRRYRQYLGNKYRKQGQIYHRITYPSRLLGSPIFIKGTFIDYDFLKSHQMLYSVKHQEYYLETWAYPDDQFLLIYKAHTIILGSHPVVNDPFRGVVNQIKQLDPQAQYLDSLLNQKPQLQLKGTYQIIKKQGRKCEDRCFITENCFGLADGVGAWADLGIDSGIFAEEYLDQCKKKIVQNKGQTLQRFQNKIKKLSKISLESLHSVKSFGSCTSILGRIIDGELEILNVGDSQTMILRPQNQNFIILLKTEAQQIEFNKPHQVTHIPHQKPEYVIDPSKEYKLKVEPNDLVISGSDGLWDNLFEEEILTITKQNADPNGAARQLSRTAFQRSLSNNLSPFQVQCEQLFGSGSYVGGKPDDISVIVAKVVLS